jgi:hypothetical protein
VKPVITVSKYFGVASWPPQPGGPLARGQRTPHDGTVLIKEVFPVRNGHLTFKCEYEGFPSTYDLNVKDERRSEELFGVLKQHVGKTIDDFGSATLSEAG